MVLRAGPYQWMSLWAILLQFPLQCVQGTCVVRVREREGWGKEDGGGEGKERGRRNLETGITHSN